MYSFVVKDAPRGKNYCLTWSGLLRDEYVHCNSADGTIELSIPKGFLYGGEAAVFAEAIVAAEADFDRARNKKREQWREENKDKKEHLGYGVTWSIAEAEEILRSAEIRESGNRTEICVDGEWLALCRTDLKDDIATSPRFFGQDEPIRDFYLNSVAYGARRRGSSFAVVDAISDG